TKRPFVLLKMAQTLDGRIATASGSSQWITGDAAARKRVRELRLWCDAIAAGAETFRLDHPALTARDKNGKVLKTPRRFIASHHPVGKDGFETFCAENRTEWFAFLERLGAENVTALLIEGGGELAASALKAGVVDQIEFHIAPKLLGGRNSRPSVGGEDPAQIAEAIGLDNMLVHKLGANLLVTATPRKEKE
ncbi:MAG: dihydrofolate reductase family protein, partial [Lentisphaeria bacterium]|nr:dihydrofolate reductase family protein [Lentisphaeria bacterium]